MIEPSPHYLFCAHLHFIPWSFNADCTFSLDLSHVAPTLPLSKSSLLYFHLTLLAHHRHILYASTMPLVVFQPTTPLNTLPTPPRPRPYWRPAVDTPIFVNPTPDSGSRDSPDIFEPEPKRARRNSFSTTTLANPYPQPSFPHDILNKPAAAPRHSLPKSKPPRPAPTRLQPGRGGDHTQPNSARATPAAEDRERPALPPPTRVPRSGMGVDGAMPPDSDVRSEAAYIIAQAAKRRDAAAAAAAARVTPPATESTPHTSAASSSNAYAHPLSPPQSLSTGPEPIIVNYSNDEAEEEDFDTAFEKVQEAYRKGIRPHRNPLAPQERTVPIRGMEDAHPPEWRSDQRPGIALAPGRDRTKPTDKDDLAHSQGYDGLTDALNSDATGFVNNVKVCHSSCQGFRLSGLRTDTDIWYRTTFSTLSHTTSHNRRPAVTPFSRVSAGGSPISVGH